MTKSKQPYTIRVKDPAIVRAVRTIKERTGITIERIATELLREGLKRKRFLVT